MNYSIFHLPPVHYTRYRQDVKVISGDGPSQALKDGEQAYFALAYFYRFLIDNPEHYRFISFRDYALIKMYLKDFECWFDAQEPNLGDANKVSRCA